MIVVWCSIAGVSIAVTLKLSITVILILQLFALFLPSSLAYTKCITAMKAITLNLKSWKRQGCGWAYMGQEYKTEFLGSSRVCFSL